MPLSRETAGLLLGAVGVVMFAGTLPASRIAVASIDPLFITAARATLPGVLSAVLLLALGRRIPPRDQWLLIAVASVTLVLGFPLFSALAMLSVPAAHGGVVLGVLPLATALAATLIAGERPSRGFWLTALAGAALVVTFALREGSGAVVVGDLYLLGAVVAGAIGYTCSGKLAMRMPGWEVIAWALALALPVSLAATVLLWPADAAAIPREAWLSVLYVALFSQFIGFFFWNAGLAMGGIARVGQMMLFQPFVIVLMAALVNGEPLRAGTLLFAAAVVTTVLIGRRMQVARRTAKP